MATVGGSWTRSSLQGKKGKIEHALILNVNRTRKNSAINDMYVLGGLVLMGDFN